MHNFLYRDIIQYPIKLYKWSYHFEIWQADRQHAAETHAKFESDRKTINTNLAHQSRAFEIFSWYCDIETVPGDITVHCKNVTMARFRFVVE